MANHVSVVILGRLIPLELLNDLHAQSYQDFELILANKDGIPQAMNDALNRASGEIFVRIDTDVRLPKGWLAALVKEFDDPLVLGATGPTVIPEERWANRDSIRVMRKPPWFFRWMMEGRPLLPARIYPCGSVSYGSNYPDLMEPEYDIDHLEGTNWAVRTQLLRNVGGFDEAFSGVSEWYDDDALFKMMKANDDMKIVYSPQAGLTHLIDTDTQNYSHRYGDLSRVKNWLRFHSRHSRFHYKKVIWFLFLLTYCLVRR